MNHEINCISYWYPKLAAAGLPVPKTLIVKTKCDLIQLLDGQRPDGYQEFMDELKSAAQQIGYPLFLRSGQTSGKHEWSKTCYVPSEVDLARHVTAIVEYSELVSIFGLPTNVWAVRELLPTKPVMTLPRYEGFPVVREFRCFVTDGQLQCVHPYWPIGSLVQGFPWKKSEKPATWAEIEDLDKVAQRDLPEDFEEKYLALCNYQDDYEILQNLACEAGAAVGGSWSVDLLETGKGWFITDMATAAESYHWKGCPVAEEFQNDEAKESQTD